MGIIQDFSDFDEALRESALFLITDNNYITYDIAKAQVSIKPDYLEIARNEIDEKKYPFLSFWICFSTGIEYLTKAVMVKHNVDIFSKKNSQYTVKDTRIVSQNNNWLNTVLKSKQIEYVSELNTGTLGSICTKVGQLTLKNIIDTNEEQKICHDLKLLADTRRNNDSHSYFKNSTLIRNHDLDQIFVPLINSLLTIYNRS